MALADTSVMKSSTSQPIERKTPQPFAAQLLLEGLPPARAEGTPRSLDVEIVVPVYNEQESLAASIERLHAYLTESFPFTWQIVIADNASTDETLDIAHGLASKHPGIDVMHLAAKGRGRALRLAWMASKAEVVCYMDVDLSTDLNGLLPLVAPLLSGHSELAIGTRLAASSRVERGPKREFISRSYNKLLRAGLRAHFSDAQCGFKAVRTDVARELLPQIKDQEWFFDTELLIVAQRKGLRIHEVPVDWIDDADSRVAIIKTATQDLRGMARLAWDSNVFRFVLVGLVSTLAYAILFLLLRTPLGSFDANAAALAITAIANTAANRRFTFGVLGRHQIWRQYAMAMGVFAFTLLLTNGALWILHQWEPDVSQAVELLTLTAANIGATMTRYVALRFFVFSHGERVPQARPAVISPQSTPAELAATNQESR
jgi:glycosyltransferase involved in cell wall biosynthesis